MKKHVFIIVNDDSFFLSHRLRIALQAISEGWRVSVVGKDTGQSEIIKSLGIGFISSPIAPTGRNLLKEIGFYRFLVKLLKNSPDSLIHLVGLKNILWGSLAAKHLKKKKMVCSVSGLGYLFGEKSSKVIKSLLLKILKYSMKGTSGFTIFQNEEDKQLFLESGICRDGNSILIKGSGVDMEKFSPGSNKNNSQKIRIIYAGRMLKEKGVEDVVEAAHILKDNYKDKIEFLLCGRVSDNPSSLTEADLNNLQDGTYIQWIGYREDINDLMSKSDIMCYPSYYREGVPKVLLEASACGLPLVTTDSIGCRDSVIDGENGILVPVHNPVALAQALEKLILNPELRREMGKRSREMAEKDYNVEDVAKKHVQLYNQVYK